MKSGFKDESQAGGPDRSGTSPAEAEESSLGEQTGRGGSIGGGPAVEHRRAQKDQTLKGRKVKGLKGRVAELETALEKAEREAAVNYDRWLRSRAEFENLRKRTQREAEQVNLRAGESLVRSLLPALDNLEQAIEASKKSNALRAMEEGLLLIHKGIVEALREKGVEAIDPLGERFDPRYHEAMLQMQTNEAEPGTVVQVLQKGYAMNGVILRPAKVAVAAGIEELDAGEAHDLGPGGSDSHGAGEGCEPSGDEVK